MNRFLYEQSLSYRGYLIIPFPLIIPSQSSIYSYSLLSEIGHQGKFHTSNNPSGIYSETVMGIKKIAQEHLDQYTDIIPHGDYFQNRYTYKNHLIIIHQQSPKFFYDHYPPEDLTNIAAPKIFDSEPDCIRWIIQGLERSKFRQPRSSE